MKVIFALMPAALALSACTPPEEGGLSLVKRSPGQYSLTVAPPKAKPAARQAAVVRTAPAPKTAAPAPVRTASRKPAPAPSPAPAPKPATTRPAPAPDGPGEALTINEAPEYTGKGLSDDPVRVKLN